MSDTAGSKTRILMPLRYKLPLLLSTLLVVVVAAMCLFGYRQIEQVLLEASKSRLLSVTQSLSTTLVESARRMNTEALKTGRDTNFVKFLTHPDSANRATLQRLLDKAHTAQTLAVSVTSRDGKQKLYSGAPLILRGGDAATGVSMEAALELSGNSAMIGAFQMTDTGVVYRIRIPVVAGTSDTLGHLAIYRTMGSAQSVGLLSDLIGSSASLLLGNTDGSLWTDLTTSVPGPSLPVVPKELVEYSDSKGVQLMGVGTPILGTPWVAWVQMPRTAALVPARRFLIGMAGVSMVVVLSAGIAGWLVSRQATTPLAEVSIAAQDLAAGHYDRRVKVTRRDEIGLLAESFNGMAARIENSNDQLLRNASELESANAELRESERSYRGLVDRLPDAVLVHREGRVVFANPAAVSLFAANDLREVVGRNVDDIMPPEATSKRIDEADLALMAGQPLRPLKVRRFNKTIVSADSTTIPYTLDGQKASMTILRDVSERERLEERFRQAQKMDAVGQLAGGVAHDFNNILTVVTSYTAMMLAEMPEDNPMRGDLQEVANASDRAATLTRQLLAFSRQQVLEPQVLDLNKIVADMEKMLRRVIPANIGFETKFDPALGRINADPGQLEQVLMNLCVNARDAMPDGGTLRIETAGVFIDESAKALHSVGKAGSYVLLTVSDTGGGMTPEQQARIFDPFFTTKAPGKGTGLGLSTVYGIVQQSGGYIWVYSEVGQGAVFRIYLPRIDAAPDAQKEAEAAAESARGDETILLVEDETAVRVAARRILEGAGYRVVDVGTGADAISIASARGEEIDLLLTDMVMPEMSGRELSAKFRVLRPGSPTIYMSGYTEDAVLHHSISEPDAFFIQKPFTPQTLTQKIRTVLDRQRV